MQGMGAKPLYTPQGISTFYSKMRTSFQEYLILQWFMMSDDKMAAEILTTFECRVPGGAQYGTGGWAEFGEKKRRTSFVHYDLDNQGRIKQIRLSHS